MSSPSRRQVLRMGTVAAAGLAAPVTLAEQALAVITPKRLTRRMFTPRVGTMFRFTAAGRTHSAVLRPLRNLPSSAVGHPYRFSLIFRTTFTGPAQGTYRFTHPTMGAVTLFVVPVGSGRRNYEAVIYS